MPTPTPTPTPTPEPEIDESAALKTVGNIVKFGHYEQDNVLDNGSEPIEWIVLDVQNGKSLLLSKYALDCQQFHTESKDITWENCSLKAWLNESFLFEAFGEEERNAILNADLDSKMPGSAALVENSTNKVLLLSYTDAKELLRTENDRLCQATEYAIKQGSYITKEGYCYWWLRTEGSFHKNPAANIVMEGSLGHSSYVENNNSVRPAIWVDNTGLRSIGNTITFGHYEQDNNPDNGSEPIEWIVLDAQDGKSLLLSKYALESRWFATREGARWDNSFIRDWLNSAFLHNAYAPEERAAIVLSDINNGYEEGGQGAYQGYSTKDKVFLLSYAEAWRYFPEEKDRLCIPTAGAAQFTTVNHENCGWWLRSAYAKKSHVQGGYVTPEGVLDYSSAGEIGVRPAIWVWNEPEKLEELAQEKLPEEETLTTGSSVFFGQYEQDGNQLNGKEPIEWKVINIDDNRCQLISKYILSQKNYEEHHFEEIDWNSSSLCEWLNGTFFEEAFNEEQSESILTLSNDDGSPRQIKVTLLDQTEYNKTLLYSPDRICDSSRVGASNGKLGGLVGNGGIWWLQTLDLRKGHNAFCVNGSGTLTSQHIGVGAGVRPVIWVDLNSAAFIP